MKQEINLVSVLKSLNIKQNNAGTSTGSKWMASKNNIVSLSPVDGKKIGSVTTTTGKEF